MGLHLLSPRGAAALALLLTGCAGTSEVALSPLARKVPEERPMEGLCGSLVYALTCVAPAGYDLLEESPGPGLVMRYTSREGSGPERSHLILRAYPLGARKLSWVFEENAVKPLKAAAGVSDVRVKEGSLGARRGLALVAKRDGGSWSFLHKLFAFQREGVVFVVEHAVPAPKAKAQGSVLEDFVASLAFR